MSVAYELLYRVGFTPWEEIADLPAVKEQISGLFDREQQGRTPPFGPASTLAAGPASGASRSPAAAGR